MAKAPDNDDSGVVFSKSTVQNGTTLPEHNSLVAPVNHSGTHAGIQETHMSTPPPEDGEDTQHTIPIPESGSELSTLQNDTSCSNSGSIPNNSPPQSLATPQNGPSTHPYQETHTPSPVSSAPAQNYTEGIPKLEPAVNFDGPPEQEQTPLSQSSTHSPPPSPSVVSQSSGASNMPNSIMPFSASNGPSESQPAVAQLASSNNVEFFLGSSSSSNVLVLKNERCVFEEHGTTEETRNKSELSRENQSLRHQLSDAEKKIDTLEENLKTVEKEKQKKEIEQQENEEKHKRIVAQKDKVISLLQRQLDEEKKKVEHFKKRISTVESERDDEKRKHSEKVKQLEQQLKEKESCYDKEVLRLTQEKHKVDLEVKDLLIKQQTLISEREAAQKRVAELKLEISEKKIDELTELHRSESDSSKAEIEELKELRRSESQTSQAEIEKLKELVKDLKKKNEEASSKPEPKGWACIMF